MDQRLAFQLAYCYKLVFGGSRDEQKFKTILQKSGTTGQDFDEITEQSMLKTKDYKFMHE